MKYEVRKEVDESHIDRLMKQIAALENSVSQVKAPAKENVQLGAIAGRIDKVEKDYRALKELLLQDPDTTLTLPLIKKDIDSIKAENKSLRDELVRLSGFTKRFIGIMTTMSIGLFGLALTILLKG